MPVELLDQPTLRRRTQTDPLWESLRREAEDALDREPALAPLFVNAILQRRSFEDAVLCRIVARLGTDVVLGRVLSDAFDRAVASDPAIGVAFRADIGAVVERDPACGRFLEPLLYFKGFHAIQAHRLAHWLWHHDRADLALCLQSWSSQAFQTDIHPAARFGRGIFLDHATGLVAGATTVVEDDVSILQDVTLGGTGLDTGDRHPKVRRGVLIGAGAKILGNIEIGNCSRIAAGSVVVHPVPANSTVAGNPARVVGHAGCAEPARTMDHTLGDLSYESFTYTI